MGLLDDLCSAAGAAEILEADDRVWRLRRSCQESVRLLSLVSITDDLVVPLDQIASTIKTVMAVGEKYPFKVMTLAHAGDGNLHFVLCKGDLPDAVWAEEVERFHDEVYREAYKIGGRLSGEHGIGMKKLEELAVYTPVNELAVMKQIKRALDPKNILNPGKVLKM